MSSSGLISLQPQFFLGTRRGCGTDMNRAVKCPLCCGSIFTSPRALQQHLLWAADQLCCPLCSLKTDNVRELACHLGAHAEGSVDGSLPRHQWTGAAAGGLEQISCENIPSNIVTVTTSCGEHNYFTSEVQAASPVSVTKPQPEDQHYVEKTVCVQSEIMSFPTEVTGAGEVVVGGEDVDCQLAESEQICELKDTSATKPCKLHQCTECSRKFQTAGHLERHNKIHRKNKSFKDASKSQISCEVCDKTVQRSYLREHMAVCHRMTGPGIQSCKVCTKPFTSASKLSAHVRKHTGEKPFHCQICQRSFSSKSFVRVHEVAAHNGDAPHKCSQCGKAFLFENRLRRHERVHQGKRPHQCNVCGRTFAYYESLYVHRLNHADLPQMLVSTVPDTLELVT